MLPPLELLNTDLAELTPEMPVIAGQSEDAAGFEDSLGEIMVSSILDRQLPLPLEEGEILPPSGNSLPVHSQAPVADRFGPTVFDDSIVTATTRSDETKALVAEAPSIPVQVDSADEGGVDTEPPIHGYWHRNAPVQPDNSVAIGQMPGRTETAVPPGTVLAIDGHAASQAAHRTADRPVEPVAHVAAVDRLVSSAANESAKHIASVASTELRTLAEKPDVLLKKASVAVPQPASALAESLASLQGSGQATRTAPAPPIQASIDVPVLDKAWGEALNERVLWMAGKSIQKAEIRLNPADLGPIRIEISVSDDAAKVSFTAPHALTRDAIESAIPRLREMLSENGISLANTDVSDTDAQQEQHVEENDPLHGPSGDAAEIEDGEATMTASLASRLSSALVDTFA